MTWELLIRIVTVICWGCLTYMLLRPARGYRTAGRSDNPFFCDCPECVANRKAAELN